MYTIIPYRYVDVSNFKQFGEIALQGELTTCELSAIATKLHDSRLFIPFDLHLNIPELQKEMEGIPSDADHVFHELMLDKVSVQSSPPKDATILSKDDFLMAFSRILANTEWEVVAATLRLRL